MELDWQLWKIKLFVFSFPLDNNGNWQMWLEMLEFALIAKEPIPLLLISWNGASECFLGIHFHSNFLFIPEAGEGREGEGAFLPPGQDHSHLLLRNPASDQKYPSSYAYWATRVWRVSCQAPGTRHYWISWWSSKFTQPRHACLPILAMTDKKENNWKSQKYENNLALLKAISLGLISIWDKKSEFYLICTLYLIVPRSK